ncbi:hypothetical protein EYF80_043386 [Liparis tanakae]|uniref:Uncharacterized protein n=1 Tax=Liparis tanakae TaxID=230148 RepID=A0A4Z2FZV0_9TELE|nr:hypothetical protein EYF80_043386 [Liparis tanakae]
MSAKLRHHNRSSQHDSVRHRGLEDQREQRRSVTYKLPAAGRGVQGPGCYSRGVQGPGRDCEAFGDRDMTARRSRTGLLQPRRSGTGP